MTDNPLVEAVARAVAKVDHNGRVAEEGYWSNPDTGSFHYRNAATAALRAIEDAGYKVVKKEEG
ncbi:hypothetical protein [Sphingomonas sp. Marseille-Q8236]